MAVVLVILFFVVIKYSENNSERISEEGKIEVNQSTYSLILERIEKGNKWVIENDFNDGCASFRYYNRGCYYKQYPGLDNTDKIVSGSLQYYNLTHSEIVDLCQKLVHKGFAAYCLNLNREINRCIEFAEDNNYLQRVCNLAEGEIIPSEQFGPYEKEGTTAYKVDSWEPVDIQSYSDFV